MSDSRINTAGANQAQDFVCGTQTLQFETQAQRAVSIAEITAIAISDTRTEVFVGVEDAQGAIIEAQKADGTWASIGSIDKNQLFNPYIHPNYLTDPEHIRLRVSGSPGSEISAPITPILTRLSSHRNNDGTISVTGSTTMLSGTVEARSADGWKGIGAVSNGVFSNLAVPATYLHTPDTMRVRATNNEGISTGALDSTLEFPHPRAMHFLTMQPAIDEQAAMFWRIRKADYQPTGYFAPANTDIEVWAWGNVEDLTLLVGTQGMADRDDPSNQSENMRATRLIRGLNIIHDPLGGAIHVRNLAVSGQPGVARVVLRSGADPMAYYVDRVTTATQWKSMLQLTHTPEVELMGTHVVIAAFLSTALKFPDIAPDAVIHSHEEVMKLEAQVSGLDGSAPIHTRSALLIYAVEGSSSKSPHATTGCIALPYNEAISAYNESLIGGLAANRWVTLHEYGHHHQTPYNSYGPFGEVTVNLYALAVAQHYKNEYEDIFPARWPATQAWLALPRSEKIYGAPESDPVALLEQLRKGLGEGFMPAWHRYIRENPGEVADLKYFVLSACMAAEHNLTEFFADWGLLKTADTEVWAAVAQLGFPYPSQSLMNIRPYVD
ncbi:M60 family metallopeptidase [Pseudomonas syringae]|uniref:M60 family metallopeptidase n=1 Tax=Pseudomonas syringae TaxID=317 RepID=UPI003F74C503